MNENDIPKGLTREEIQSVNQQLAAREARKIEGETDRYSVFEITFDDGCNHFGYTSKIIVDKVDELCRTKQMNANDRPNYFVAIHNTEMGKTVQCLYSSPERGSAMAMRNRVVEADQKAHSENTNPKETCTIRQFLIELQHEPMRQLHESRKRGHKTSQQGNTQK